MIVLASLGRGGAERVTVSLANELARRGHCVEVVLLLTPGELRHALSEDVSVVSIRAPRLIAGARPLAAQIRSFEPDAILACIWPTTTYALAARMLARSPARLVLAEHTTWSSSELLVEPAARIRARCAMAATFRFADAVVAVSDGAADDLARFAQLRRDRITRIYNPVVDSEASSELIEAEPVDLGWWTHEGPKLLAVGSLKVAKDYPVMLLALRQLVDDGLDAKLLVLGAGPEREKLQWLLEELGLTAHASLGGAVGQPEPYYERADLLVLSSRREGLPTVLIEALAAGTPVASTDCRSGPREILVDGEFGSLCVPRNPRALAMAVARELRMKRDPKRLRQRSLAFSVVGGTDAYEALLFP